jgi:hypothetical protein
MAKISTTTLRDWNNGETMNEADYEQERSILVTAINDNYDRLIKKYEVLNADGTIKSTQNLDTAINYVKLKEDSTITLVHDALTSTVQIVVTDGSITTAKLASLGVTTAKIADGNVTTVKLADLSVSRVKIADGAVDLSKADLVSFDTRYYTETEIDTKVTDLGGTGRTTETIKGNADTLATHKSSGDHDTRYYTKTLLDGGQLDNRYYTETEIDNKLSNTAGGEAYSFRKGTAFPTSPLEGDVFYRTDIDKPYSYTGVEWKAMESDLTEIIATNHSQDRLLANHEAWFDVDGRATPNSGKYYDLLDGTNDLSIGLLDSSKGESVKALTASTTSTKIQLDYVDRPVTKFKAGQEVTIFDDVNLERQVLSSAQEELTTIDHSTPTRVSKKYDTSGNGGRKLVRLDTGALIVALKTTQGLILRKSTDNGLNWSTIKDYSTLSNSQQDVSLETDGVNIFTISARDNSTVVWYVFDENGNQKNVGTIESSQNALGNCSLTINSAGTELHASWASKNATYPNSFNIRYAKGTIASDGSVTWSAVEQVTQVDTYEHYEPAIVFDGTVPCITTTIKDGTSYGIRFLKRDTSLGSGTFLNTSWSFTNVHGWVAYAQSNPSVVFVPASVDGTINGTIHVTWHGRDATDTTTHNIRYSKSTDGGATWSAMEKLTSGNTLDQIVPSITANKSNKLFIMFIGYDGTAYQLKKISNDGTGWSVISTLTSFTESNTTEGDRPNPSTCINYTDFTEPLTIYTDKQIYEVKFYGTFQGYAPFLTVPSLTNSYKVEATIARSSVIVDTVNKLLSFGGWKHTATFDRSIPTTVVASAFDTSGNGGRKSVRLDDGSLVNAVYDSTNGIIKIYKSIDNGNTWTFKLDVSSVVRGFSLVTNGNFVYLLRSMGNDQQVINNYFDSDINPITSYAVDSSQSTLGQNSITINESGTELHASWASKNATYPNSFNIRYAKGTINADGSVTWGAVEQLGITNTAGSDHKNPTIIINSNGYPVIARDYNEGTVTNRINVYVYDGTGWSDILGFNGDGHIQSNPSAVVDGNGVIHVTWHGLDSTDATANDENIRYSKSTDGGATWSAMEKLTSGADGYNKEPSITINKDGKIFIIFYAFDSVDLRYYIYQVTNDGTGWTAKTSTNKGDTGVGNDTLYPSTLVDLSLDFSQPLTIYRYNGGAVYFEGVWQDQTIVQVGVEDVRYNIDPSQNIDEAVAWVTKDKTNLTIDGAISIVGSADNESYMAMTKTTTEIDASTDEDQFVGSVATANSKVALRLTLNRTDKTVKKHVKKLLGAVG